jgi:hypothetical protein
MIQWQSFCCFLAPKEYKKHVLQVVHTMIYEVK